jgi:glycyl-tRNA synthetase
VRERLDVPRVEQKTIVEINKKLFGPAFKKDAKTVENHLIAFNSEQAKAFGEKLKAG